MFTHPRAVAELVDMGAAVAELVDISTHRRLMNLTRLRGLRLIRPHGAILEFVFWFCDQRPCLSDDGVPTMRDATADLENSAMQ